MPPLTIPQNRGPDPTAGRVAMIEAVHQPIYSAIALEGAGGVQLPFEVKAFTYTVGQRVPGAGTGAVTPATIHHTNMEEAGAMPFPKVFEFVSFHQVVAQLDAVLTAPLTPTAAAATDAAELFRTVQTLFWGTSVVLHVGEKDYLKGAPAFMTPANVGIGGIAAVDADDQATAQHQQVVAVNGAGRAWEFDPYRIFLPSQQQFHAAFRCPTAAALRPTLVVDVLIYFIAHGVVGREVM